MKGIVPVLFAFLVGCASMSPKEELRDIFTLVKDKKFSEADLKLKDSDNWFKTYSDEKINSLKIGELVDYIKGKIEFCENELKVLRKRTLKNQDEENQFWYYSKVNSFEEDFNRDCGTTKFSEKYHPVFSIKEHSSVDFSPIFSEYQKQCKLEAARIKSELKNKDAQENTISSERKKNEKAYLDSTTYLSKTICNVNEELNYRKDQLSKEKEVGTIGGVTNQAKIYEISKRIQLNQDLLISLKERYKNKSGITWTKQDCAK